MPTKYGSYKFEKDHTNEDKQKLHPVWRGVGFVMMILIPIMSYASMDILLKQNERTGMVVFTQDMLAKKGHLIYYLIQDPMIYVKIGLFIVCAIVFFAIFQLISFFITSLFGVSPKNDPFYVPPVRRTTPRSRRR